MMKRSIPIILSLFLVALLAYFYTPLGPRLRGYAGRLWNNNRVALKTDNLLSERAYDWQLISADGSIHNFAEERDKVIFLNFWATWCAPCLREIPDIQKLYDDYGKKVHFLLVTEEGPEKVNLFVEKTGYTLPIYITEKADIPEEITSKSLPTTYIIDASGKIIRAETGAANWNSIGVRKLLESLVKESD